MTLDEAKALTGNDTVYSLEFNNADGTPERWRVNGKVQTWVRYPERVKVPVKRGLYQHGYLTECNLDRFTLNARECTDTTSFTDKQ